MARPLEPISVRTTRLNNLILGQSTKTSKFVADAISRESLLDAFCLLYTECDKENIKKRDKNVTEFISKYRPVIEETNSLRVSCNDFSVKSLISKGYFGNVHLVVEKTTKDVYAMKKVKKSVITTSQVKEERDIMAKRSSDWITNLQYAFQDSEYLYLVMEYLPGGDLLSLMIRSGPFEEDFVKFYLAELTLAINDLHNMGYVHRDIKPANILIDRFGHIKLADFGMAAALNKDGHVISLSPVGTPDYIAPELLQTISTFKLSKSTHDVTCDFWSMGIIGYEMVYETTPFHEENIHETYSKILSHCEDSHSKEIISFPNDVKISENFKNLIESLVIKRTERLPFNQIKKHSFFDNIQWDKLHHQVPPIIPNVNGNDDVSNFEDIERIRGRRSTFAKKSLTTNIKSNDFSGKDLPFLGYGFVHEEKKLENIKENNDFNINKLNNKIKDMQTIMKSQTEEIKCLQENLLKAEKKAKHSDSTSKILSDAKEELIKMKERLKQKTMELAACKTEVKTLQSSLKIEEEQRLKSDATISEVLSSTYKKWEKAKTASDHNYEKQIAEKKTELSSIAQKLLARENELVAKSEECSHLQEKIDNYKEMLKSIKEQAISDKQDFEKNKLRLHESYETKLIEMKNKLKMEKDSKNRLTFELRDVRSELDDTISSTNSNMQAKLSSEKNISEIKIRLSREIELNNNLRGENAKIEKQKIDVEKHCEVLRSENDKLKQELQLIEATKTLNLGSQFSSPYQTAHGSLTELHAVEEQLRNDLQFAKENEEKHKSRADQLEKAVAKLEGMIGKLNEQPATVGDMLEKQNEKLEDKLVTVREQMVLERQSARTANLALWKAEKQIEDLQHEKKQIQRRMDLTEEKIKRMQNGKSESDSQIKSLEKEIKQKDARIQELKDEIVGLKRDVQKGHRDWEKAEQERMKEKSEVVQQISQVHRLQEKVDDLNQNLLQSRTKNDTLSLENKRLLREINEERDQASSATDSMTELQIKLKSSQDNYEMLKMACNITDQQLTEIECLLDTEVKRNKTNIEKIDNLYKSVRGKDETIAQLKKDLNLEMSKKIEAEAKIKNLSNELDEFKDNLEYSQKQMIAQQNQLIVNTNDLFGTQEKLELLTTESSNLQTMNTNFEKEINILKEENAKILTELFLTKEENNKVSQELKESNRLNSELSQEVEQLNASLEELKNYYLQRDIKSEATLSQHKKLIDYLQLKVEDLSLKKKKSFADKIFGTTTPSSRKENYNPNTVETSILYRTLQEELKREKIKNKSLQEQLNKYQEEELNSKISSPHSSPTKRKNSAGTLLRQNEPRQLDHLELHSKETEHTEKKINVRKDTRASTTSNTSAKNRINQIHRFELNLENSGVTTCIVCHKQIVTGSPFWQCKECKCCVHRKCRGDVTTSCGGIEISWEVPEKDSEDNASLACSSLNEESGREVRNNQISEEYRKNYYGDIVLSADIHSPPLEINCAYEMADNIILLGCNTGFYAYQQNNNNLVKITGIDSIQYIAVSSALSKAIIIGDSGTNLYQCDLRQIQNRSQSNARMKPSLNLTKLDLPFDRNSNDKWHLVKISNQSEHAILTVAIAATSTQILVIKYDVNTQRFKPVRALDTATSVSSILFTRHTAIVSSDKFFEIDLSTYSAEEFLDLSDPTLNHINNYQPMAVFSISPQEFLVCFTECGIFVDEYGCRSRPYELNWEYTPTGFIYQEPFLYISHFQLVQIVRIHRSYRNEVANNIDVDEAPNFKRAYLNLNMATLLTESGDVNCYSLAINRGKNLQELFLLDGLKALKDNSNISMETLSSQATCLSLESATTSSY